MSSLALMTYGSLASPSGGSLVTRPYYNKKYVVRQGEGKGLIYWGDIKTEAQNLGFLYFDSVFSTPMSRLRLCRPLL